MDINTYLKKHGLNISSFVLKANKETKDGKISQPTIWRILNFKGTPRHKTALAIEKATGGEVKWTEVYSSPMNKT
jgi:hypothetical protein